MFDVPIHTDSDCPFRVVPFEVHPYVLFGFPMNFEQVFDADTGA